MKRLTAVSEILFENHNYKPGDELPIHNAGFVKAWIDNGAAIWQSMEEIKKQGKKARAASAPAGLSGNAYPSAGPGQDLAGKPPPGNVRGAQPEPSKRRRKTSS